MTMMRKATAEKIARFTADNKGRELNHFQFIDTNKYPCWQTLKKYGVIEKVETVVWYHGEGECDEVNIYKVK